MTTRIRVATAQPYDVVVGEGLLDIGVGVPEASSEPLGQQPTHGALACAGRTDEDDPRCRHRIVRLLR